MKRTLICMLIWFSTAANTYAFQEIDTGFSVRHLGAKIINFSGKLYAPNVNAWELQAMPYSDFQGAMDRKTYMVYNMRFRIGETIRTKTIGSCKLIAFVELKHLISHIVVGYMALVVTMQKCIDT